MVRQTSTANTIRSDVPFFPETTEAEGKRSFDYRCSRPQKTQREIAAENAFHSSGQASNSLDWEINELKVSKRNAVAF